MSLIRFTHLEVNNENFKSASPQTSEELLAEICNIQTVSLNGEDCVAVILNPRDMEIIRYIGECMRITSEPMQGALIRIQAQHLSNIRKWGVQDHSDADWLPILGEEFGEINKAIAGSVVLAWLETIERRRNPSEPLSLVVEGEFDVERGAIFLKQLIDGNRFTMPQESYASFLATLRNRSDYHTIASKIYFIDDPALKGNVIVYFQENHGGQEQRMLT
jgi:hypothetical protein